MDNKRKKRIVNMDMTFEECKNVLDTIDGLVVIDNAGTIKYLSPDMFDVLERIYDIELPEILAGKNIAEIHPTSKIKNAFIDGNTVEDYFYFSEGIVNVARIKPIYDGDHISGAVDYDLFVDSLQFIHFMQKATEFAASGTIKIPASYSDMNEFYNMSKQSKKKTADILGKSSKIKSLRQKIYDLAESDSTVLITGETGTGKEIVAQAIHGISKRSRFPIVEINCASIPENLFESELFGYEEGTFTGANRGGRPGKFELANKGTIFLDEVDQIPYHAQPKLLRVLQEREVVRIGGQKTKVDIRIIAATNKNLRKLVAEGKFREDLYYRLDVINIAIPSLRERKEDIPLLAKAHIEKLNPILNCNIEGISDNAMKLLMEYEWPGNVRELHNIIERAMNECKSNLLDIVHFRNLEAAALNQDRVNYDDMEYNNTLEVIMNNTEKAVIERALRVSEWNVTAASELLNISRPCLHYKIKKHGISNR